MSIFIKSLVPIEDNTSNLNQLKIKLHYIFPNADAPYNISKVIRSFNDVEVEIPKMYNKAYDGIVYCCLHVIKHGKVFGKETLPCHFSITNATTFDPLTFSFPNQNEITKSFILMHNTNNTGMMHYNTHKLQQAKAILSNAISSVIASIERETNQIQSMEHLDSRTSRLHSVEYHVSSTPVIYLPFSTLTMRGKDLFKNINPVEPGSWKSFFNQVFLFQGHMTTFMKQSYKAYNEYQNNGTNLVPLVRGVYNYIVTIFSQLVQKYITYKRDIDATIYRDYVGVTRINDIIAADCEDIAQIGHDLVRIFRKLYPIEKITNQTPHLSHISYWLQLCDVFIVQGAVGAARDPTLQSHIWTMLSPTKILETTHQDVGSFIIEGTGEASPGMYQYIHHVWHFDSRKNHMINAMLVTTEAEKEKIGIRMYEILIKNIRWFINNRSIQFQNNVLLADVKTVLSLNPQEYHPIRLMIELHNYRYGN